MLWILVNTEVSASILAVKINWCKQNLGSLTKLQSCISFRQCTASSLILSSRDCSACRSTAKTLASWDCPSCSVSSQIQTVLPSPTALLCFGVNNHLHLHGARPIAVWRACIGDIRRRLQRRRLSQRHCSCSFNKLTKIRPALQGTFACKNHMFALT